MKNTLFFALLIAPFFIFFPAHAAAEDAAEYLRVEKEGVVFYESADELSPLFFLPYSYYVKKCGEAGDFYHVEAYGENGTPAIDGYVKKSDVNVANSPVSPFLSLSVLTETSSALYETPALSTVAQVVFKNREVAYYGDYVSDSGARLYYVYYNGKTGYLQEDALAPFTVPAHPTPVSVENPTESIENETEILKIAVVCSLIVATLSFFTLIVVPEKKEKSGLKTTFDD